MRVSKETTRKKWAEILDQWAKSGKSAWSWAQEQNISYVQLNYWKKKLLAPLPSTSFVELQEEVSQEIEIRWKNIRISLAHPKELADLRSLLGLLVC